MSIFAIDRFDLNEWFLIIGSIAAILIAFALPKRLPRQVTLLLYLWGFTNANFYDFTIGGGMFDFYDVNDSPRYCVMDFFSFFFYAPFSYLFIYTYEWMGVKAKGVPFFILGWSILALGLEWLLIVTHVITYLHGYRMYDSFAIYLFTQSATLLFYKWLLRDLKRET